jgi:hypothetical protein
VGCITSDVADDLIARVKRFLDKTGIEVVGLD